MEKIQLNDIEIELFRSAKRKTVSVIIERDGRVISRIPDKITKSELIDILKIREEWIHLHLLAKKEEISEEPLAKEYVPGEGFYYLGKRYRLKLLKISEEPKNYLQLKSGWFQLPSKMAKNGKKYFINWYKEKGREWLKLNLPELERRVPSFTSSYEVRDLGYNWGSCSGQGKLQLNWRAMMLPKQHLEYVILHELVHLEEPNHGAEFYNKLRKASPYSDASEDWLKQFGAKYNL